MATTYLPLKSYGYFSRCPMVAISSHCGPIWPYFKFIKDFIAVLPIFKYEEIQSNHGHRAATLRCPYGGSCNASTAWLQATGLRFLIFFCIQNRRGYSDRKAPKNRTIPCDLRTEMGFYGNRTGAVSSSQAKCKLCIKHAI